MREPVWIVFVNENAVDVEGGIWDAQDYLAVHEKDLAFIDEVKTEQWVPNEDDKNSYSCISIKYFHKVNGEWIEEEK